MRKIILTHAELQVWLARNSRSSPCSSVSMLNGFISGLVAGPSVISVERWLREVTGDCNASSNANCSTIIKNTILHHYEMVTSQLDGNNLYKPILLSKGVAEVTASEWADGFLGAILMEPERWRDLVTCADVGESVVTILMHCSRPWDILGDTTSVDATFSHSYSCGLLPQAVKTLHEKCKPLRVNRQNFS